MNTQQHFRQKNCYSKKKKISSSLMSILSASDYVYWLEIFCICSGIVQSNTRLATDTNKQMQTIPLQPEVKLLICKTGSGGTVVVPV